MAPTDDHSAKLGTRLRHLRELAKLTQRRMATLMDMNYQMIQLWEETGNYRARELPRMAQVLGCSIEAFFDTDNYGRPTRATQAVDRPLLDAAKGLTPTQRLAIIDLMRALSAEAVPAAPPPPAAAYAEVAGHA
jgi:transcriptional regulator with XRE-family HTH domain